MFLCLLDSSIWCIFHFGGSFVCNIHLIEDIHVFLDKNTLETIVIKEGFVFQFLQARCKFVIWFTIGCRKTN